MEYKKIKHLKVDWLKNINNEGGAQSHLINIKKKENNIVNLISKKHGRMWAEVSDEEILELTKKDNFIYEVICDMPHKVYFDIDADNKDYNIFYYITKKIDELFPNSDMAISGSYSDIRQSYHIVLNNYLITSLEDREQIKNLVKTLKETFDDSFDARVYQNNKIMKCFNQSKGDGRIQKIILNEDEKKHFISTFINSDDFIQPLPKFEETQPDIHTEMKVIEAKAKKFNVCALPTLKKVLPSDSNFDINNFTPLEALEILPLDNTFPHNYTHLIARFCFHNGLTFNDFYSWYKNKQDNNASFTKWTYHFSHLHKFPPVSKNQIMTLILKFYPSIRKENHFTNFQNLFKLDNVQKIDALNQDIYYYDKKFLCINTGMGSGKTYQTVEYLKNQSNFIWITPNIALAQNTRQRLNEANINVSYYKDYKTSLEKDELIHKQEQLMICLNSLHYTYEKNYKVVIIDEIETVLNKWFDNNTLKGTNKIKNWVRFLEIINNADKVIFLDAFTSKITTDFIKSLNQSNQYDIIELNTINVDRKIHTKPSFESWTKLIIEKLKEDKKVFIFYPFKEGEKQYVSMENFKSIIEKNTNKKGISYHGETDDQILKSLDDVNTHWKKSDFILTNSKINVGINYENKDFDSVFLSIANFSSPRDLIQVSYRCRFLKSTNIYVSYLNTNKTINFENDYQTVGCCNIYRQLIDNILKEKYTPLKMTFNYFCNLAHYKIKFSNEFINKELDKTIKELFNDVELGYSYDTIKVVSNAEKELIQQKIYKMEATMDDKLIIKKYYYQKQFKNIALNELSIGWDKHYIKFFTKMSEIIQDDNNIFNKVRDFNNWGSIFPSDNEINKVKLNDELVDRIFENFFFKDLTKNSTHKNIVKNMYNTNLGKTIIKSKCDKSKNYELFIDDEIREMFIFACDNLKIDQKKEYNNVLDDEVKDDEDKKVEGHSLPAQYIQYYNRCIENKEDKKEIETINTINSFEDLQKLANLNKINKTKKINEISYLPSMKKGESEMDYRTRMINLLF
jgi:hypothetical protein